MSTERLFVGMPLPDVADFLTDTAEDLAGDTNETVQALRVVLEDAALRIQKEFPMYKSITDYMADPCNLSFGSSEYFRLTKRVECNDGFHISVQASAGAYCSPRNNDGPWYSFELSFPSSVPNDEILSFAEQREIPLDTVYGYVPIDVVDRLMAEHGGIKGAFIKKDAEDSK